MLLANTSTYVQYMTDSIAYGSLFALMALSLSLLFGVMGLMNFAYGELIMVGAYTMYYTERYGWLAMILATFASVILFALVMELVAFRPVRRASASTLLITSFALSIGLQKLFYMIFPPGSPRTVKPYPWLTNQFEVKGVLFSRLDIAIFIVTILLLVGMVLLLKRTQLGIQLRASTEDFRMAQLVGVKANRVISSAFAITGFLAAAVTILYMLRSRRRAAERRSGPAADRVRGSRHRRARKPGRCRARRLHARHHDQPPLGDPAPLDPGPHADVRVPARDRDARVPAERPQGNPGQAAPQARRGGSPARGRGTGDVTAEASVATGRHSWLGGILRTIWTPLLLSAFMVAIWLVVTRIVDDVYYTQEAEKFFLRLLIVLALMMFCGNSGILSFGHVAFMAVGAYTSALLTIPTAIKEFTFLSMPGALKDLVFPTQLSAFEGTIAGGLAALVVTLVFGVPIVRLIGVAAGIATLAILVAMNVFIQQTSSITRGTSTQIGVPLTTTMRATVIWVIVVILAAFFYKQSRFGLRLRATRENDPASRSVGINVARERYIAFALSGFVCGIAGALYAHYFITFSNFDFYFDLTFLTIAMLVVGGMGSVSGAVVGTSFLTVIYVFFQRFEVNGIRGETVPSGTADVVMALALLVALILRPKGLTAGRGDPVAGRLAVVSQNPARRRPPPRRRAPSKRQTASVRRRAAQRSQITRLPKSSTSSVCPGWTSVVVVGSSITSGPGAEKPMGSPARS